MFPSIVESASLTEGLNGIGSMALEKGMSRMVALQHDALLLLLLLGQECCAGGMFENLTNTLICLCRTLQVLVGGNLLADFLTLWYIVSLYSDRLLRPASRFPASPHSARKYVGSYLFGGDWLLAGLVELFDGLLVVT